MFLPKLVQHIFLDLMSCKHINTLLSRATAAKPHSACIKLSKINKILKSINRQNLRVETENKYLHNIKIQYQQCKYKRLK